MRAEAILMIVDRMGPIQASEILKRLGGSITMRTLQREPRQLRESGFIVARGRREATRYEVKAEDGGS